MSLVGQKSASLAVGRLIHGYRVLQEHTIPELHIEATLLRHEATGAGHLHLARPDDNNLFAVQFRTTPRDSTGVAHILEHTVLCGSRRFPVRDPFFRMLTRSVSSFMNALTASDWTMYPFVTQNTQDFRNLMDVYMDAVLHPKLTRLDFMQEGWRIEPNKQEQDNSNRFNFSGVVFNEMKGVFTDNDQRFSMDVQQVLLPTHTYGVCSGGSPEHIPLLTWEQLRIFHSIHYHPSNARFYTYGSLSLEENLKFLHEQYLSAYVAQHVNTAVPLEPRWSLPRTHHIHCANNPALPVDQQATLVTSYVMGDICDIYQTFVDDFIASLLVNGNSSPFYRALLEPRFGQNFAPIHGFDSSSRSTSFHVGLKGVRLDNISNVFRITQETFENVAEHGFDPKNVKSLLHQLELSIKHQSALYGLNLVLEKLSYAWNHDADPIELISFKNHLERLQNDLKDANFLRNQVRTRWLQNTHRLETVMVPKEKFAELEAEREASQLAGHIKTLDNAQLAQVQEDSANLLKNQNQPLDTSCLPRVRLVDMKRAEPEYPLKETVKSFFFNETATNGVTYLRAFLPLPLTKLSPSLLSFLPLLCKCLTKIGAGGLDYRAFAQQEELYTGGMSVSVLIEESPTEMGKFECGLLFSSHCLDKNQTLMMDLWSRIFNGIALDDDARLKQIIEQRASNAGSSLVNAGHQYAMCRARGALGGAAWYNEMLGGLEQLRKSILLGSMKEPTEVAKANLKQLARLLMHRGQMRIFLAGESAALHSVQGPVKDWLRSMSQETPSTLSNNNITSCQDLPRNFHLQMPNFMVNYVARSFTTVPLSHPFAASLRVLAQLITSRYLHREVREKGGAYGGGAVSSMGGQFSFFSYRDPNSLETLKQFENSVFWLLSGDFSETDLEEAQLAVFKQLDAPKVAYAYGLDHFINPALTHSLLQEQRDRLFTVRREQLLDVCQAYLVQPTNAASVIIGPENKSLECAPWCMENLL